MATAVKQPFFEHVSWGALWAGFFFGFAVWALLLALGAGVGFSTFNPRDVSGWQGLGLGVGIWGIISGIIASFFAAWLAARVSASRSQTSGMFHGVVLWGFMLVVGMWIATMAVARTTSAAAGAVGTAAQTATQAGAQIGAQAANNPRMRQQAQQQMQQAQQQGQQLMQEAQQNAGQAASAVQTAGATSAWAFFIYAVLTLIAAILGGRYGIPRETRVVHEEERVPPPGAPLPHRA